MSPMNPDEHDALMEIRTNTADLLNVLQDHERRIRSLELVRNWFVGLATFVGTLFGIYSQAHPK